MVILFILETAALLALYFWCVDSDARRAGINPAPTIPLCSSNYFEVYDKKRHLFTVAFLSVLTSYKSDQKRLRHQNVPVELFASRQSRQ